MKKTLLLTTALLMAFASLAMAQAGVDLAWQSCKGAAAAQLNRTFACNSDCIGADCGSFPPPPYASAALVGTFRLGTDLPDFTAVSAVLDLQTDAPALPDWWQLGAGGCRAGSLNNATQANVTGFCLNPYSGSSSVTPGDGGFTAVGNRARYKLAIGAGVTPNLLGTQIYGAFRANLDYKGSAGDNGDPVCNGCATPVCIVLNEVRAESAQTALPPRVLTTPITAQYVTWQGGGTVSCPAATPSKSATWGQVKALYR